MNMFRSAGVNDPVVFQEHILIFSCPRAGHFRVLFSSVILHEASEYTRSHILAAGPSIHYACRKVDNQKLVVGRALGALPPLMGVQGYLAHKEQTPP